MKYSIVLGAQFGDEGKGSFTNYLCSQSKKPIVIRFNGGHQAGHTVLHDGNRHTFSSFGSGTLQNVPTFWSKFCTVFPTAVLNEYNVLKELGIKPNIYFDPLCPITTPYDVLANIQISRQNNHGTVGVGFGTTINRQEAFYKLHYQDLFNKTVLEAKMANIKQYYGNMHHTFDMDARLKSWYDCIDFLIEEGVFTKTPIDFYIYDHVIFEGAQGILLDQDFGFFPNVTRSNTTSKNVQTLLSELEIETGTEDWFNQLHPDVYYITRPYQTRHGVGFMSNRDLMIDEKFIKPALINTENEINIDGGEQGIFRKSILDLDLLQYAIECDNNFSKYYNKTIVITCLDQLKEPKEINYTINKELHISDLNTLKNKLSELTGIYSFIDGISEGKFNTSKILYEI
jgi:adenylosuccinate synthase